MDRMQTQIGNRHASTPFQSQVGAASSARKRYRGGEAQRRPNSQASHETGAKSRQQHAAERAYSPSATSWEAKTGRLSDGVGSSRRTPAVGREVFDSPTPESEPASSCASPQDPVEDMDSLEPWIQKQLVALRAEHGGGTTRWPKYLGSILVPVRATATLEPMAVTSGAELVLKVSPIMSNGTGSLGRHNRNRQRQRLRFAVRVCTAEHGREFGRLEPLEALDLPTCLGALQSANLIIARARAVDCPLHIRFACVFIAEVAIFAAKSMFSFAAPGERSGRRPAGFDADQEDALTHWIAQLFHSLTGSGTDTNETTALSSDTITHTKARIEAPGERGSASVTKCLRTEAFRPEDAVQWILAAAENVHVDAPPVPVPPLLASTLRPYQQSALNWMVARERAPSHTPSSDDTQQTWREQRLPDGTRYFQHRVSGRVSLQPPMTSPAVAGGILADEMGLGKTVEAISLMLANPRPPQEQTRLDRQAALFTKHPERVTTESHRENESDTKAGGRRAANAAAAAQTRRSLVDSCCGGTLIVCPMSILSQWCAELNTHVADDADFIVHIYYANDRETDPLVLARFQVVITTYGTLYSTWKSTQQTESAEARGLYALLWHRLILDEAHVIKNPSSGCSRAVLDLRSRYRWALTGTPLQNNLEDIYPLLRFLAVEPWSDASLWKRYIARPFESGQAAKMQAALSLLSSILQPLMLRRTKRTLDEHTGAPILELPAKQTEVVYVDLSAAERQLYDAVYKASRARFSTFLADNQITFYLTTVFEMLMRIRQLCDHPLLIMSCPARDLHILQDVQKFMQRLTEGRGSDQATTYLETLAGQLQQSLHDERSIESSTNTKPLCPICLESIDDAVALRNCAHVFCRDCILTLLLSNRHGNAQCPVCRKGCSFADVMSTPRRSRFRVDLERGFFLSTKLARLVNDLVEAVQAFERDPVRHGKCVVFSQWTGMLDLIERALQAWNHEHARTLFQVGRLDGTLSQSRRTAVLEAFATMNPSTSAATATGRMNVLLASLRAGGVGLNLTAASSVFLVDPWWNPYVEEQAMDRVHRMGQTRTVQIRRYIVRDSVEERMLLLQDKKRSMVEDALGSSGTENQSSRLADLLLLFSLDAGGATGSRSKRL